MINFPMPFAAVPCKIWLPVEGEADAYNNVPVTYNDDADIETTCCYTPGTSSPQTADDIEDGRPYGVSVGLTFYLPKTLDANLRGAKIACYPTDDSNLSGRVFYVEGEPFSYPRANTPGDYSWSVEGVAYLG